MNDAISSKSKRKIPRRYFLITAGVSVIGLGTAGFLGAGKISKLAFKLDDGSTLIPASEGYLLVDSKKCQGCTSCMMACSLVHEGEVNYSLSRIQILQNSFEKWPDDLAVEQCRQCVDPACVKICPEKALRIDEKFGNVRRVVDIELCVGCGECVEKCAYKPSRAMIAPHQDYDGDLKARKCDLCANTPYHWDKKGGGPQGVQACVEICTIKAITFTASIPQQEGDAGYQVNLRDRAWAKLGYPIA